MMPIPRIDSCRVDRSNRADKKVQILQVRFTALEMSARVPHHARKRGYIPS